MRALSRDEDRRSASKAMTAPLRSPRRPYRTRLAAPRRRRLRLSRLPADRRPNCTCWSSGPRWSKRSVANRRSSARYTFRGPRATHKRAHAQTVIDAREHEDGHFTRARRQSSVIQRRKTPANLKTNGGGHETTTIYAPIFVQLRHGVAVAERSQRRPYRDRRPNFRSLARARKSALKGNASTVALPIPRVVGKSGKNGKYEGQGGLEEPAFTVTGGESTFVTHNGTQLMCKTISGLGEFGTPKQVAAARLLLDGCERLGVPCTGGEAKEVEEGDISTSELKGELGWISKVQLKAGLELFAEAGAPVLEAQCGGVPIKVSGSVVVAIKHGKGGLTITASSSTRVSRNRTGSKAAQSTHCRCRPMADRLNRLE